MNVYNSYDEALWNTGMPKDQTEPTSDNRMLTLSNSLIDAVGKYKEL